MLNHLLAPIIFVGAGASQLPAIQNAKDRGHSVVVIENDRGAPGCKVADEICDSFAFRQADEIIQWLLNKHISPAAVLSFCSDAGIDLASRLSSYFGLRGDGENLVPLLTNKQKQREALQGLGVNPYWKAFHSEEEVRDLVDSADTKLVLKPADSAGSRGVAILAPNDPEALHKVQLAFENSKCGTILVEEFLEGTEFTLDGFVIECSVFPLLMTEKRRSSSNPTVADQLVSVAIESREYEMAVRTAQNALQGIGRDNGPFHIELIISGSRVKIVEIAGRGGGFLLASKMIAASTGVDYTALTLDFYLGRDIRERLKPRINLVSILEFIMESYGIIQTLEIPDLQSTAGSVVGGPLKKVGDEISMVSSDGDRLAWMLASSGSRESSEQALEEARSQLTIEMNP
jgi:carbamoyl-phosphate synthase large subunit